MMVNTEYLVPMTEANQNFSRVVRTVDESGLAVILKNNKSFELFISLLFTGFLGYALLNKKITYMENIWAVSFLQLSFLLLYIPETLLQEDK